MDAMPIGPTATCMPPTVSGHPTRETVIDDRYLVERRIGVGATAAVYRAKDLLLPRNVAIRLLHDWFTEDDEVVERFRREASTASGLHDPHIVAVYESGEWDGTPYIVQLKLTDFGIARLHESDVTQTGAIIGTAQYLSPEQIQGERASVASDLYAIGIILYELLTGRVPFDGDTIAAVLHGHIRGRPTSPGALNPAVIPQLDSIAIRALAKNPRERFVNTETFIAALEHVATNLTTHNSINVARAA
jgi:serine/threonine protein kinase